LIYDKSTGLPLGEALTLLRLAAIERKPRRHLSRLRPGRGYFERQKAKADQRADAQP
jgi:hypothetical protein